MKQIVLLCALCALLGCKQATVPETEPIALYYATSEQSKTDILTQGDQIGIFAAVEGTENYFLDNRKYVVGSDGRSLSTSPAVYYPEAKQAVAFTAYLPFGGVWNGAVGTFSVPADQSTSLKQADLCWAKASSTPVVAPVALEFQHKMARLLITTNEPTSKIVIPNVFSGGTLDIRTGTFTNTLKSSLSTSGTELILPAQTITRLVLTVAGVEYIYDGSISLETAKTTSISLTLNPSTKTATLSGSSAGEWGATTGFGNPTQAAVNTLTIHWPKCHPKSGSVDKVMLRIKDQTTNTTADYTVSSGITYANQTFTVPFASTSVFYPYVIEYIQLYRSGAWLHESTNVVGGTVVKRGDYAVGVRQPLNPPTASDYVTINGLKWGKGNLIALSKSNNRECKIGAPTDHGLFFQFGGLIGYKSGAVANGGTGTGVTPYTSSNNTQWWGGATSYSWANEATVWPLEMVGTKARWTNTTGSNNALLSDYYFNYSMAPWEIVRQNIRTFAVSITGDSGSGNLASGRYAKKGLGDPCTYFLGVEWRLPLAQEWTVLYNNQGGVGAGVPWANAGTSWTGTGASISAGRLFIPAGGYRFINGAFNYIGVSGFCWSSSICNFEGGLGAYFISDGSVYPQGVNYRSFALSARCVSDAP